MSRVTIDDIASDYFHDTSLVNGKSATVSNVEIVPRKIVENIIAYCESQANFSESIIGMLEDSEQNAQHKAVLSNEVSVYRGIVKVANGWLAGFERG